MVAQQVLRQLGRVIPSPLHAATRIVGCALAATLLWPAAATADEAPTSPTGLDEPEVASAEAVVVIDLRTGDTAVQRANRAALAANLAKVGGIELPQDPILSAALAGERVESAAADNALGSAREAYGAVDCAAARSAAHDAILRYAALQAAGDPTEPQLRKAHVYELLCAHSQDDTDAAQRAASQLRQLGASAAPQGVGATVWDRYPAVDAATNVFMAKLTVTTVPAGAEVWVDHVSAGAAPVTVTLPSGPHLFAAATGKGSASRFVDVSKETEKGAVSLWLDEKTSRWDRVRRTVAGWRSGENPADAIALGVLMTEVGVRFACVVAGTDQVEVWGVPGQQKAARRLGTAKTTAHFELGAIVLDQVALWEGRIDETELLGGAGVTHSKRGAKKPQKWWVYAVIVGAVALGAGILLAGNLADDHQRIELTWP